MRPQWAEIEALDNRVSAETQTQMLLEGRRLVERGHALAPAKPASARWRSRTR